MALSAMAKSAKVLRLDHVVNLMQYQYPTLFRVGGDPAKSRLLALEHVFLHYGTAMEWHPKGFMYHLKIEEDSPVDAMESLPEGFFDKTLFDLQVRSEKAAKLVPAFKAMLRKAKKLFYVHEERRFRETTLIFEWDRDDVRAMVLKFFGTKDGIDTAKLLKRKTVSVFASKDVRLGDADTRMEVYETGEFGEREFNPYPTSKYSPIREIMEGKTNSLHVENFDLKPQPDWLAGAVEVARASLAAYNGGCPGQPPPPSQNVNRTNWDLRDAAKKGEDEVARLRKVWGFLPGETVEQQCERTWQKFLKEETKFFERFLAKFDKKEG